MKKVEHTYFNCLCSLTTNDARCTRKIKFSYYMAKAALNKNMTLFTSQLDLNLRKHLKTCYSWNVGKYIKSTLKVLKCGFGEGWRKSAGWIVWKKQEEEEKKIYYQHQEGNKHPTYEGHLESKERFAIKKYLLIIGKKKNMQVLSHTFTYFYT